MQELQERYDDAMFVFSRGEYDAAERGLAAILEEQPDHFEAQLALGMVWCRRGDFDRAIAEGLKALALRPQEQLAHTNLSLFYLKKGDKTQAEHHALQSRIASWKGNMAPPGTASNQEPSEPELKLASTPAAPVRLPPRFPERPWQKKPSIESKPAPHSTSSASTSQP